MLLSHSNRNRVVANEHRPHVYLPGLRVAATLLVDGFVAGVWRVERAKGIATLMLTPFGQLQRADQTALTDEAERLIRFVAPDVAGYRVTILDPV